MPHLPIFCDRHQNMKFMATVRIGIEADQYISLYGRCRELARLTDHATIRAFRGLSTTSSRFVLSVRF